jgi:uncharacterized membrane protein
MSQLSQRQLIGAMVSSLIVALVIWVWPTPYSYIQIHQNGCVQTLRENRLTGAIATFNQETKHWDYREESRQEQANCNRSNVVLTPGFVAAVPDHHVERGFLDTSRLHKACLLADAIVHSRPDDMRQFTREDFQLAERCMAYVTGVLDTLPGKVEIIGGSQCKFAFRRENVLVGKAVDSFNQYVQAHPESVNWSGAETLAVALVNDNIASWLDCSVPQPTTVPTKTANE